ncbi:MAG: NAD(P)-dependent oxidoreductase [Fidelibacterota bacterium]
MKTLVLGATGATGKQLIRQLLAMKQDVKVIIRSPEKLPEDWHNHPDLTIIKAGISDINIDEMADYLRNCDVVASCLGHNLNFKGLFGKPRRLVTDAVWLICQAIHQNASKRPVKVILMNTTANRNRDLQETYTTGEKIVMGLVRLLLPPQKDNEQAAEVLRSEIGHNDPDIEWVAVRPDSLINEDTVTDYSIHPSPIRSPIFDAGRTSRINVGNFMARLITGQELWQQWKGQMPVIYNEENKQV